MSEPHVLRVADLRQSAPTAFDLRPDAAAMASLAADLGLAGLRKLRFSGQIAAHGARDWRLEGRLGATLVQPCVVTLAPVTTRIDTPVTRLYLNDFAEPEGPEIEMPGDDETEPLGRFIDAGAVMAEALALAVPLYPRAADAQLGEAVFAEPGTEPLRDHDTRPFAGLARLREPPGK